MSRGLGGVFERIGIDRVDAVEHARAYASLLKLPHGFDRRTFAPACFLEVSEDVQNGLVGWVIEIGPGFGCEGDVVETILYGVCRGERCQHADAVAGVLGDRVLARPFEQVFVDGTSVRGSEHCHAVFAVGVAKDPRGSPPRQSSVDKCRNIHRLDRGDGSLGPEGRFELGGGLRTDTPVLLQAHGRSVHVSGQEVTPRWLCLFSLDFAQTRGVSRIHVWFLNGLYRGDVSRIIAR